jgi:transposase
MEQWTDVRRAVLAEGVSKGAACRKFGIHWDTLERILHNAVPPGYVRKQAREKSVIAPWLGRLWELIEANHDMPRKQRYTVKRMWQVLHGEGFTGGYTTVKDAVREIREEAPKEVFMPLSQPPGEAQVDFGHAVARIGGRLTKVVFFVMSLIHSDAMFVMAFPRECTEAFLEAHLKAFAFFGFVASRISYDNTKMAVTQITGAHRRKLTAAFARLVGHYLFRPHFCRIRRANEKGVVEGAVRYSRQNFMVPVPQVADWIELNAHLLTCCRSDMTRRLHGKTLSNGPAGTSPQAAQAADVLARVCRRGGRLREGEPALRDLPAPVVRTGADRASAAGHGAPDQGRGVPDAQDDRELRLRPAEQHQ